MEELREEVESNDDYHGHHHKIRYFYDCDICTIYTINLCVFFLFFQQTSHFLRWGKPFTNKVFLGEEMTWSLGHCEKGHLFVMIFGYSNFSEAPKNHQWGLTLQHDEWKKDKLGL
jgi:hypothetical protein